MQFIYDSAQQKLILLNKTRHLALINCHVFLLLLLLRCATAFSCSCVSLLMDEALAVSTPAVLTASLSGRAMAFWDSWQGKGRERFFYHSELLADVAVHLLTLLHHVYVWLLHGMSFNLLDALLLLDTRVVLTSFVQRVKAHMMHRCVLGVLVCGDV